MKRTYYLAFIFLLFLLSQKSFSQERAPQIHFPETFKDFGETIQNTTLTHSFAFKNKGTETLIIEDIKSG